MSSRRTKWAKVCRQTTKNGYIVSLKSFNGHKCVLLRFHSHNTCTLYDYKINNIPIQALDNHRDLGIVMSGDMTWSQSSQNDHSSGLYTESLALYGSPFPHPLAPLQKKTVSLTC